MLFLLKIISSYFTINQIHTKPQLQQHTTNKAPTAQCTCTRQNNLGRMQTSQSRSRRGASRLTWVPLPPLGLEAASQKETETGDLVLFTKGCHSPVRRLPRRGMLRSGVGLLPIVSRWDIPLVGSLATRRTMGLGGHQSRRPCGFRQFLARREVILGFFAFLQRMGIRCFFICIKKR